ncbi:MAG: GTP-binding protein [Candidatus Woesearchaeota archaeon]|nr:MAG: GTP-binding protein [Candidatus Woesearchaeota archaeon]
MMNEREQMNIVIVGHVDHGKSTLIGRLLADTDVLPDGKLEQIKEHCRKNSREFEYAFLLDALKDEQSQGITIDSARCFFKSDKRRYLLIDAPGHIEFLKNMISGAARAESALLLIDAQEGIQENSKRHGYMLSMLGIKQVAVCVNKMDLVKYDKKVFSAIETEYTKFLSDIGITPQAFIPVSAREGDNIASSSKNLSWFTGKHVLEVLDSFAKEPLPEEKPLRMPIQGVYKFTKKGDDRRLIAGRIESGTLNVGDEVVFLPSNKRSIIKSIEEFNAPTSSFAKAGQSVSLTLQEQIYVNRGELMTRKEDVLPQVSSLLRANIFWMGKTPLSTDKRYKLKLGTTSVPVMIKSIESVLDASNLDAAKKAHVERHEVAECILECQQPIAFDLSAELASTGRFVLVDEFDIAGGGIIAQALDDKQKKARAQVFLREQKWEKGHVSMKDRAEKYSQLPTLLLLTGKTGVDKKSIAKLVEKKLFDAGRKSYFLGIGNILRGIDADITKTERDEHVRRFGEVANLLLDAGLLVVGTASDLDVDDLRLLQTINKRGETYIVHVGDPDGTHDVAHLLLDAADDHEVNALKVIEQLKLKNYIFNL